MARSKSKPTAKKKPSRSKTKPATTKQSERPLSPPSTTTRPPTPPPPTWDEILIDKLKPWWLEFLGGGLALVALITLLGLLGLTNSELLNGWTFFWRQLVGWGAYLMWLSVAAAGIHLALRHVERPYQVYPTQVIGFELLLLTALPLTFILSQSTRTDAYAGRGGGLVGWALSTPLLEFFGPFLSGLLYLTFFVVGLALLTRFTWADFLHLLRQLSSQLQVWATQLEGAPPSPPVKAQGKVEKKAAAVPLPIVAGVEEERKKAAAAQPSAKPQRDPRLPPFHILAEGTILNLGPNEIENKKLIIERTLADFGLPAAVTEIRQGPSVTQFGVKPGYVERPGPDGEIKPHKVRVGQIASLRQDLALALAVRRLRIEAPIPGRGLVGVEVPNDEISMVRLRSVIETDTFRKINSSLAVGLGLDVSGSPVATDLGKLPHLLIAGTTGAGKSVAINALVSCLVFNNTPELLKIIMIDPKKVELIRFNGLPHLLGKVEVEAERALGVLRWLTGEMDRRYKAFVEVGARQLSSYNRKIAKYEGVNPMPHIVLFIDELADLMGLYPADVERSLCRLAQMARATGIHLVVATQRPSTDVITGLIKANFPSRLSFAVASGTDSRVILDSVGAENLLGRGDMLFLASDASAPARIQGCFVSDLEIEAIVNHWQQTMPEFIVEEGPWDNLIERKAFIEEKDDLLEQAIALAQQYDMISTSLLQRRLRVGYPRAARLMEALYEMELVEDPKQGGRTRRSFVRPGDDPIEDALSGR